MSNLCSQLPSQIQGIWSLSLVYLNAIGYKCIIMYLHNITMTTHVHCARVAREPI